MARRGGGLGGMNIKCAHDDVFHNNKNIQFVSNQSRIAINLIFWVGNIIFTFMKEKSRTEYKATMNKYLTQINLKPCNRSKLQTEKEELRSRSVRLLTTTFSIHRCRFHGI